MDDHDLTLVRVMALLPLILLLRRLILGSCQLMDTFAATASIIGVV